MRFELPLLKVGLKGFLEEVFLSYMTSIRYGSVKRKKGYHAGGIS